MRLDTIREELSRDLVLRPDATYPVPVHSKTTWTGGIVPDAITATRIAQAIWSAAYGAEAGAGNPQATENYGNWKVIDGPLFAVIQGLDGKVLAMGQNSDDARV